MSADDKHLRWLKLHTDMLNDDKLLLLDKADRYRYVELLLLKRAGVLDSTAPKRLERVASSVRETPEEWLTAMARLLDAGLIDEQWHPRAWDRRQAHVDTDAAIRMRNYRARLRGDVGTGDEPVTERVRNACAQSYVLEVEEEVEVDTEGEKEKEGSKSRSRAPARGSKRMPADWKPDQQLLEWAEAMCPLVDFAAELQAIRDCEFRVAHSDWSATVRNWMRREQKQLAQRQKQQANGRESKFNRMQRRLDDV